MGWMTINIINHHQPWFDLWFDLQRFASDFSIPSLLTGAVGSIFFFDYGNKLRDISLQLWLYNHV